MKKLIVLSAILLSLNCLSSSFDKILDRMVTNIDDKRPRVGLEIDRTPQIGDKIENPDEFTKFTSYEDLPPYEGLVGVLRSSGIYTVGQLKRMPNVTEGPESPNQQSEIAILVDPEDMYKHRIEATLLLNLTQILKD